MTPTWKADMPKTISTFWVHSNVVVDCGLLKISLSRCGESQGEIYVHTSTHLAFVNVVYSCKYKMSPVLKPSSEELIGAHC